MLLAYALDYYSTTDGADEGACADLRNKLESADGADVCRYIKVNTCDVGYVGNYVLEQLRKIKSLNEQDFSDAKNSLCENLSGVLQGLVMAGWDVSFQPSRERTFGTVKLEMMTFKL